MSVLLFIGILLILIVTHEFGHFAVAKLLGMRVDEFGIGFPPRIWGKKIGATLYSINWIPFGGFVAIPGENYEDAHNEELLIDPTSFATKPKWAQALVLLAGVAMNWLTAFVIITFGFIYGLPVPVSEAPSTATIINSRLLVTQVLDGSAAQQGGLTIGDELLYLETPNDSAQDLTADDVLMFVRAHETDAITVLFRRGDGETQKRVITPSPLFEERPVLGIGMEQVGIATLPFFSAVKESFVTTARLTVAIGYGFYYLIADTVSGQADFSAISGPVGLVGMVGDANSIGFIYVLTLMAVISLNLAVLNLVPFPALDGGRLLFVIIEAVKGSPLSPKIASRLNAIGFFALIGLMLVVTVMDIIKL
ncbi:MAG: site-2 protease family protein [bacterium]|nr:site-2 protease family protein [bacterium]